MGENTRNHKVLDSLFHSLCSEFGPDTAGKVFKVIIKELNGTRVSIPQLKYLYRMERNERIRQLFYGGNYRELACRFGVTENTIRNIVHGD